MLTRRQVSLGLGTLAFSGLVRSGLGDKNAMPMLKAIKGYGALLPDPHGLLDLPKTFSYKIISQFGEMMSDGLHVPDRADGMGCIPLENDKVALIRNHELHPRHLNKQPASIQNHKTSLSYDHYKNGVALPGGTSTIIYDTNKQRKEKEFLSLTGMSRNCAGGVTPWKSWLTCEENVEKANEEIQQDHGYVFEVFANADKLTKAEPLKAMGRFNHEAAAVDPATGIVYLTEDRGDSLFYRFIPNAYGQLKKGGKLQALAIKGMPQFDTRNWQSHSMSLNHWLSTEWIDIKNPESPEDDLRYKGNSAGAAVFARGEGIHWGDKELYFCCTNGGHKRLGQIMRYQPSPREGQSNEAKSPGRIQLFLESTDESLYDFGDNLTVAPNGHLIVCEDQYYETVDNYLRGVSPSGEVYPLARIRTQTEPAGACFSPDGKTLFVNLYSPTKTLAISGPWESLG
ncbi:MAG: alkaline phosphatase PhoX [Pseudomonadota bacterium]